MCVWKDINIRYSSEPHTHILRVSHTTFVCTHTEPCVHRRTHTHTHAKRHIRPHLFTHKCVYLQTVIYTLIGTPASPIEIRDNGTTPTYSRLGDHPSSARTNPRSWNRSVCLLGPVESATPPTSLKFKDLLLEGQKCLRYLRTRLFEI